MSDNKSLRERVAVAEQPCAASTNTLLLDGGGRPKVDFLPLSDVLGAIARRIEVRDDELVSSLSSASRDDEAGDFTEMFARGAIKDIYRSSRAAAILGLSFSNTPADLRPRWFDIAVARGEPWQSEAAGVEGHTVLVEFARWEHVHKEEERRLGMASSRWRAGEADLPTATLQFRNLPTIPRVRQIGFDRAEILEFLLAQHLSNTLVVPFSARKTAQLQPADDMTTAGTLRNGLSAGHARQKSSHPLNRLIERAIADTGGDRTDVTAIWGRLVEMAQSERPPPPMLRFVYRKGIAYVSSEDTKIFKKDALRKQLIPSARGQKKRVIAPRV